MDASELLKENAFYHFTLLPVYHIKELSLFMFFKEMFHLREDNGTMLLAVILKRLCWMNPMLFFTITKQLRI